jgi:hypoxia up-regulated 1
MAKLRKQVRRTKEVLSANSAAPISVEELHEGKDFQSSIKREEFEALAGDYWKRVAVSLTEFHRV